MQKGYQLIEPPLLSDLMVTIKSIAVTLAVFSWLIDVLHVELKDTLGEARLEIVRAEYVGRYPSLGIHYPFAATEADDLGPVVEAAIERVLRERPILDLLSHVVARNADLCADGEHLLHEER